MNTTKKFKFRGTHYRFTNIFDNIKRYDFGGITITDQGRHDNRVAYERVLPGLYRMIKIRTNPSKYWW
jgi:hypothetical protein